MWLVACLAATAGVPDISRPVRGLKWPRGFQEVKVPRFLDNGRGWW
jgi:hypothetical protein